MMAHLLLRNRFKISWLDRKLRSIKYLRFFFKAFELSDVIFATQNVQVGWGRKPSGLRATRNARRRSTEFCLLEDGFLRSVENDASERPVSVVFDNLGIYYDSSAPSRLERLIDVALSEHERLRTKEIISSWRKGRISKYNARREYSDDLNFDYVLVIDQTFGDLSIIYGGANADTFDLMLQRALSDNPECKVLVKTHPDVSRKSRKGYFTRSILQLSQRITIIDADVHSVRLIEHAKAIYCVTSQVGFEGLIWGKPVHVFGTPFYAGWGLTVDYGKQCDRRHGGVSLCQLVYAALVKYCSYVSPFSNEVWAVEEAISHLALQRRMRNRFPPKLVALDFSPWKRRYVEAFCQGSDIEFCASKDQPTNLPLVVWGAGHENVNQFSPQTVVRVEDGFLRSVGLGADLVQPISWVQDLTGIYYDATGESDLEKILNFQQFTSDDRRRASLLRGRIVSEGLSKYNLGGADWRPTSLSKKIILVVGQVEDDASIQFGAREVGCRTNTNLELLHAVRVAEPNAHIVFKPHPDVLAGLRNGGASDADLSNLCDEILVGYSIENVIAQVDEVHVITSLTGFECLLRGVPVTCHGIPFYAGWGLTNDQIVPKRRNRKLSLDELVAATLFYYGTYVSRINGHYLSPELAVDEIINWGKARSEHIGVIQSIRRKILRLLARR